MNIEEKERVRSIIAKAIRDALEEELINELADDLWLIEDHLRQVACTVADRAARSVMTAVDVRERANVRV